MNVSDDQRTVSVRVLTDHGWVRGNVHPPKSALLADYLTRAGHFVRLTDVSILESGLELPFLALRKENIIMVVADTLESRTDSIPPSAQVANHVVHCLIARGSVSGNIALSGSVRVSDFFMNRSSFVAIRDVTLNLTSGVGGAEMPVAYLNTDMVIGVSELPM